MLCISLNKRTDRLAQEIGLEVRSWSYIKRANGLKEIALFRDTSVFEMNYLKYFKKIKKITLVQEGLVPFDGFSYNLRSRFRRFSSHLPSRFTSGLKPYFYSADQIIALDGHEFIPDLETKIIDRYMLSSLKGDELPCSSNNIYFATDFYRLGLRYEHFLQIESFNNLKKSDSNLRFRPHPSETALFQRHSPIAHEDLDFGGLSLPPIAYGSLTTSLVQMSIHGAIVKLDEKLGDFVNACQARNVKPILV